MSMPCTEALAKVGSTPIDTTTARQVRQACVAIKHCRFQPDRSRQTKKGHRVLDPQTADLDENPVTIISL